MAMREQEGVRPDESERDGSEENDHHAPEKDRALYTCHDARRPGSWSGSLRLRRQCCKAGDDMDDKECLVWSHSTFLGLTRDIGGFSDSFPNTPSQPS